MTKCMWRPSYHDAKSWLHGTRATWSCLCCLQVDIAALFVFLVAPPESQKSGLVLHYFRTLFLLFATQGELFFLFVLFCPTYCPSSTQFFSSTCTVRVITPARAHMRVRLYRGGRKTPVTTAFYTKHFKDVSREFDEFQVISPEGR